MKIIVLGAGLIGEPMEIDLAKENKYQFESTVKETIKKHTNK